MCVRDARAEPTGVFRGSDGRRAGLGVKKAHRASGQLTCSGWGLSPGCRGCRAMSKGVGREVVDEAVELDSLTAAVEAVECCRVLSSAVETDHTFRCCRGCRVLSSCRAVELSRVCQGCRGLTLEWLHLMGWLYLRSIHQGRCPLTSVAIKGLPLAAVCLARCALHPGVICPRGWRSLHPCTPQ